MPSKRQHRLHARRQFHPKMVLPPSAEKPVYSSFCYDASQLRERKLPDATACAQERQEGKIVWINMDGLQAEELNRLCTSFGIHPLMAEDIMARNERPKMEESGSLIFCVLPQMFFNDVDDCIELEQVSIVLGKDFVLSFQEEARRDVFNPVRARIRDSESKLRLR
ncbi:MAG: hypothetical protein JST06_02580, partial [Bacteroidetes bacterium]|nr:hypothetical protein [Bacteroidota bacterium]